ncbi:Asp-tRNA(Asn)/Glu-tRNA(Gln) amidotransferase subunit GatA [bacterium]|nr:Asp-tRNA(Asn)/Glu-tRNA(Gln) amidotransferase subunit GatA [bacterium]MDY3021982.1 Asp-tRNA(Asn)/Glu-tRNA(Gln) amidotransferase subunit GatA [Oliverpabstia sp.]
MEMLQLTARELSRKIRDGEISVKETVDMYREQMEKMEPQIHAFLSVDEDRLAGRIQEVEEGIKSGRYSGPLAGVPVAVKDNICTRGQKTTCASKILENFVPAFDAEAVKRLEDAGMIVLGKTNMDEFAMGSTTETSAFGVTKNPWNIEHVPGGSSGGSCAAVAAGEAVLALGSDTGGSIRQPAAYCGVTGLKPTYGRVSRYGLIAYASSLDQIGPVGRNVKDCAALFEVIAGHDAKDSTSSQKAVESWESLTEGSLKGKKIGIPKEYFAQGTDEEVKKALTDAMELMKQNGAEVEYFSLKMVDYVIPAYYIIACAEASSNLERFDGVKYGYRNMESTELHEMYKKSRAEGFGEEVKRRILLGSFVLSAGYYDAYYLKALKAKALIKKEFDQAFEKYDCILAPASPTTAPKIGTSLCDPLQMYLSDIYTVAVNLAGLPAVSLPCGRDSQGLPVGMQIIGDCFQEKKILQTAAAYEALRGPFPMAWEKEEM